MTQANPIPHADLLSDIDAFCDSAGMSRSRFGSESVRDPRFVFDIEAGRECRGATVRRVRAFMAAYSSEAAE